MKTKKRIAVLAPDLSEHGGVQSIVEMVVRLIEASDRYECQIISLATSAGDPLSVKLRSPATWLRGVRTETREWRGRQITHVGCLWSEFEFMRYRPRRALTELLRDCDLVQVVCGFPAWGASIPAGLLPVVNWAATRCQWERSTQMKGPRSAKSMWRNLMTRFVDRIDARAVTRADMFMVMNPMMREYAVRRVGKPAHAVVDAPPGVDTDFFVPPDQISPVLDNRYILSVGRWGDSRKNPVLLLDAFIRVRDTLGADIRLVLAGATGPDTDFWEKVKRAGVGEWVSFHASPSADELRALYQGAACFALSSNEEGFGVVLVEAMACATPVVATRCGGPEGIITDGEDGFLVSAGDADALAVRLLELLRNREMHTSMRLQARQTAVKRFSEEVSGKAFSLVWDTLMSTKSMPAARGSGHDVLVFIHHYLPGFEAGGALRSLANIVELLGDEFNFHIVTSNHDLLDRTPYPGVACDCWVSVGKARVWYLSGRLAGAWALLKDLRQLGDVPVYLNSLFDPRFSLLPLVLAKLGLFGGQVIVGPRGELSAGALQLKSAKKRIFLSVVRALGLYRQVDWHASTLLEKGDIARIFFDGGIPERVHVACDLVMSAAPDLASSARDRDLIFLSRISRKKNLDYALRVLAQCHESLNFHIYGTIEDEAYWDECQALISGLPEHVRVVFHGAVTPAQVPNIFASHGLFFFPTRGENYGHVIAEALAAGLPVLLSDQTPWTGIVEAGAGWVLPLDDAAAFANAVDMFARMESDDHNLMSAAVRSYAGKTLCPPKDVEDSRRLFLQALPSAR